MSEREERIYFCLLKFLAALPKLNTLYLSHNKLQSVEDIEHLKECKSLSVVDLSHNYIEDADAAQVFSQMQNVVSYLLDFYCKTSSKRRMEHRDRNSHLLPQIVTDITDVPHYRPWQTP